MPPTDTPQAFFIDTARQSPKHIGMIVADEVRAPKTSFRTFVFALGRNLKQLQDYLSGEDGEIGGDGIGYVVDYVDVMGTPFVGMDVSYAVLFSGEGARPRMEKGILGRENTGQFIDFNPECGHTLDGGYLPIVSDPTIIAAVFDYHLDFMFAQAQAR